MNFLPRLLASLLLAAAVGAAAPAPATAADEALTEAQRQEVRDVVRQYLRDNPEVLVEAIRALRAKDQAAKEAQVKAAVNRHGDALTGGPMTPVAGNPDGDVTVVEFFDYRCGYCKKVFPTVQKLLDQDDDIRMVFKEFPILGPDSVVASKAALAVWRAQPDRYVAFHNALMQTRGKLSEGKIVEVARSVGVDTDAMREGMETPEITRTFQRNRELARALNISGTPAFVIGEKVVPGAADLDSLKALVAAAREG